MIIRSLRLLTCGLPLIGLVACSQTNPAANLTEQQTSVSPASVSVASSPVASSPMASSPETPSAETSPAASGDLTQLFSKIWRITASPSEPALGSIYIFLAGGAFLQTSCVETYAISGWTVDKANPGVLQVSENGEIAYTAEILELTNTTLRLRQRLIRSNETQDITLTAVEEEFVCPDLPR